jgi:hypothetical protein
MRRITQSGLGLRVSLFTVLVSVAAAIVPLVALAGNGNGYGS